VQKTIFEAAILVVVVILLLQTWRASIIPIVAIPVSLIGSFAVLTAFGFSLNNLSLFGLVLAIGIVVKNVERNLPLGMSPKEAAHRTMDEVGGALIAIALVLSAVCHLERGVLTGRGADIILIDDPIEARRGALRRAAPGRQRRRLHEDDLVGQVLAQEQWEILRFPAIAEADARW
jgi:hypothetical protein